MARIIGHIELPGTARLLDEIRMECKFVVTKMEVDLVNTSPLEERSYMAGDTDIELMLFDSIRLPDSDSYHGYDPRSEELRLQARISRLERENSRITRLYDRLKARNPDEVDVPALQQTVRLLQEERKAS